jgi:hypothetical protein
MYGLSRGEMTAMVSGGRGKSYVEGYCLVKGTPGDVEKRVNQLLEEGWGPFGELHQYTPPNTKVTIFVQPMIKYAAEFFRGGI